MALKNKKEEGNCLQKQKRTTKLPCDSKHSLKSRKESLQRSQASSLTVTRKSQSASRKGTTPKHSTKQPKTAQAISDKCLKRLMTNAKGNGRLEETVIIPFRLTSLNEYVSAERTNRFKASHIKKKTGEDLMKLFLSYEHTGKLHHHDKPVRLWVCWIVPDKRRRDLDNMSFAMKFICDALTDANVIKDDSLKYVQEIHHSFEYVDGEAGCHLTIEEI